MASSFVASVILKLVDQMTGPMSKINSSFSKMRKAYQENGAGMREVGRSMSTYITAPLVGLGAFATKTAVDFESAFAGVRKTVRASNEELLALNDGLKEMSTVIPQGYVELANLARVAGQLGIEKDNILAFTKTIADLSVTTLDFKGEEAAQQMARFANIVQMSQSDVDRLGSTISLLGDQTATSEARIMDMGLRVAGAGKQIGLSEAEILGFSAALSSLGMEAQAGGTAISRIMIQMLKDVQKGGENLEVWARTSKMSAREFKKSYSEDALGTIMKFISGVTDMGEKSALIFDKLQLGGIRTSDALRRLAGSGDLLTETMKKGNVAWEENTYLAETSAKVYETSASQFKMFWNELKLLLEDVGKIIVPILRLLVSWIRPLIKYFMGLPDIIKKIIMVSLAMAAALGPVIGLLGVLVGVLAAVKLGMISLFPAMKLGMLPLVLLALALAGAFTAVATAIVAISTAWENLKKGDLMGATTFGLVKNLVMDIHGGKEKGAAEKGQAKEIPNALKNQNRPIDISMPGMIKSATEIVLKIVGDKASAVQSVDKQKGDADVNVITQGYLGLLGAN